MHKCKDTKDMSKDELEEELITPKWRHTTNRQKLRSKKHLKNYLDRIKELYKK